MPTFNELYFDHYGSINLNPEITDQINAGVTWSLPENGAVDPEPELSGTYASCFIQSDMAGAVTGAAR